MDERPRASPTPFFTRIAWAFFGALTIFALTSFLSYHLERHLALRVNELIRIGMAWAELAEDTEELEAALEKRLVVDDVSSRAAYDLLAAKLREQIEALAEDRPRLPDLLAIADSRGMSETLLAQAAQAIEAQGRGSFERSNELFRAFSTTGEYLRTRIHQSVVDRLRRESANYRLISARLARVGRVALLLILGGLVLAMLVLTLLSYRLTRPLAELAEAARRVSRGDFSREISIRDWDEVGYVAEAFNQMSRGLARHIQDLREKSALEVRLRERELENLAMQNVLQETRLQALQGQMNPHFLFNTLNAGVHLANLERADRTAAFFENVGRLFRYNLRHPGLAVALEEELDHVDNYVALLRMRFGENSFAYTAEVDPLLLDLRVPRLTLQPLVENAYLHGLAGRTGGKITLRARWDGDVAVIEVADDGRGIREPEIEQALRPVDGGAKSAGSIGLANVVARLRIWTGLDQPVLISGSPGRGTMVTIHLRQHEREE